MVSLAVFDFDRTIVDDDSDATIINKLREKKSLSPPEWNSTNNDWTPYMRDVFEHAYTAGFSPKDILDAIGSMPPTGGVKQLIGRLSTSGWDVLVITDANSVFVEHWLKVHDLEDSVIEVVTNRAFWKNEQLYIEPCMQQSGCPTCPSNLCKSIALAQWCSKREPYPRIIYVGDGQNDFCPVSNLPANAIVFPRAGYPLDQLTKAALKEEPPSVLARVVPWDDCYTIIDEIFPNK